MGQVIHDPAEFIEPIEEERIIFMGGRYTLTAVSWQ
jgi:hypothetical protein